MSEPNTRLQQAIRQWKSGHEEPTMTCLAFSAAEKLRVSDARGRGDMREIDELLKFYELSTPPKPDYISSTLSAIGMGGAPERPLAPSPKGVNSTPQEAAMNRDGFTDGIYIAEKAYRACLPEHLKSGAPGYWPAQVKAPLSR